MRRLLLCPLFISLAIAQAADEPFRVPEGFVVTQFAGDALTHDTWALTVGPNGQVAVSGPGYIKILQDKDRDGIADLAHVVSDQARNAHGLLFEGNDLFSVQPHGIFRHRDTDKDGFPDGEPELFFKLPGGGGEHGPHGLRKGPDGWFYLAAGNNSRITKDNNTTETAPIPDPIQGTILRISPDGKQSEVIAHGFRNHYDLAFNKLGHLFTFDSDGERDHQLPWYSYCRVFHVRIGGHHGWLLPGHQRSFNRPPYFFDSVDRLIEIDRGSPTGVEVYRHHHFPKPYQDGLFFACWTYGRIYYTRLTRLRDTYRRYEPEIFMETTGNLGFAPSDLAVDPTTGHLFVSVGGRGTRGAVYRVSNPKRSAARSHLPYFKVTRSWSVHKDAITLPAPVPPQMALAQFKVAQTPEDQLTSLRHLMLALGDISTNEAKRRIDAGYSAQKPDGIPADLRPAIAQALVAALDPRLPGDPNVVREIGRLLAMLKTTNELALPRLASGITSNSHPTRDAHMLFCLAQLPGERTKIVRERIAYGFLNIDRKRLARKLLSDRNWTINLRETLKSHLETDPMLSAEFSGYDRFLGYPEHAYLLDLFPKETQQRAARNMLTRTRTTWSATSLSFVRKYLTPEDLLPLFRAQWKNPALQPHLAPFLSKHGTEADRELVKVYTEPPSGGVDLTPFNEKMKTVDWAKGDVDRGRAAYSRYTCVTCHSGNRRLGPDLKNIAKRFNRDDLFRHIYDPNLAVSDLYKATQITTKDGTYVGLPVYKSEAQTILETGAGETIRFSRHDILTERRPNQSPMPPRLLLGASPEELADLYAFLKTL